MTYFRYNPDGVHFAEMFEQQGVLQCLPGVLPSDDDAGEEWDDDLVSEFPHLRLEGE